MMLIFPSMACVQCDHVQSTMALTLALLLAPMQSSSVLTQLVVQSIDTFVKVQNTGEASLATVQVPIACKPPCSRTRHHTQNPVLSCRSPHDCTAPCTVYSK